MNQDSTGYPNNAGEAAEHAANLLAAEVPALRWAHSHPRHAQDCHLESEYAYAIRGLSALFPTPDAAGK